jgi:hypothetical protein
MFLDFTSQARPYRLAQLSTSPLRYRSYRTLLLLS